MASLASNTAVVQEQFARTIHATVEEIKSNVSSGWSFFNQLASSITAMNVSTLATMFTLQTTVDTLSSLDIAGFMWKSKENMTKLNDTVQHMRVIADTTMVRLRDVETETLRLRDFEGKTSQALQRVSAKEDLEALSTQLNALSDSVEAHIKVTNKSFIPQPRSYTSLNLVYKNLLIPPFRPQRSPMKLWYIPTH